MSTSSPVPSSPVAPAGAPASGAPAAAVAPVGSVAPAATAAPAASRRATAGLPPASAPPSSPARPVTRRWMPWPIAAGAFLAFLLALPTVIWRALPGLGLDLGTPEAWRALQHLPGEGTGYVLGLSAVQLAAAACCLLLAVDVRRVTPSLLGPRLGRALPRLIGGVGLLGALLLAAIVVFSVLAWDRVDPFAGQPADAWSLLCLACYLAAAAWPVVLAPVAIGYLARGGRGAAGRSEGERSERGRGDRAVERGARHLGSPA
ncbi:hypothetical protein NLU66_05925 [Brachybacterium sp. NBEC-018]|uniref:hypothetical protein n=1 Tax=Brachybacterium sp. NBEC-018 TaxID=2996004 RepID=UPI0021754D0E|nr:hypothetical protein [Brachybacterium sp. NBEC-018]UVY85135.1 hypothetical protein NLU66_05925 [Brachybacterium sp. NBEC-018]